MNETNVTLTIDGIEVAVPAGSTILDAAVAAGVRIPTLCYLKEFGGRGSCRMCVVEAEGVRGLVAACTYPASDGLIVRTNTPAVRRSRRMTMELILSNHRTECTTCARSRTCELRTLADELNVRSVRFDVDDLEPQLEQSAGHLVRDNSKCILCGRCVAACRQNQEVGVIGIVDRGFASHVGSVFDRDLAEVGCVRCGQCIAVCPTGALSVKSHIDVVNEALADPTKHVVAMPAPSVRVGLGDRFGLPIGENVQGKMVSALKRLGFDQVFDVNWGADVTIVEEAAELIERLESGEDGPMFTSCCPGWVAFAEFYHHELLGKLSSCRSPQQMIGGLVKTYYARRAEIDPADIVVVSIMPCTAKKYEVAREEQRLENGQMPVDVSITTSELADMIVEAGMTFARLPESAFDPMLGEFTGAGAIFGASGGVMEAALRTAAAKLSEDGAEAPLVFEEVRGREGVKEATYEVGGRSLRVCAVSGLANAERVIRAIEAGEASYDFVEVMACPGGCVNGAGQPVHTSFERMTEDIVGARSGSLYGIDRASARRRSHENAEVRVLYADYLGQPGGAVAHEILHTSYAARHRDGTRVSPQA